VAQEAPRLAIGIGEVDEQPVARDAQGASEDTLDDEDPAPAVEVLVTLKLHELERMLGDGKSEREGGRRR
jgi:hypothetical protein